MIEFVVPKKTSEEIEIKHAAFRIVCHISGLTPVELRRKDRSKNLVYWRYLGMTAMRSVLNLQLNDIGEMFGLSHHATVIHGIRKVKKEIDAGYQDTYTDLKKLTNELSSLKEDEDNSDPSLIYFEIENEWLNEELAKTNRELAKAKQQIEKLTINQAENLDKATFPDWERLSKQEQSIGSDAVIQAFKAWYDSNEGKVLPARLRK